MAFPWAEALPRPHPDEDSVGGSGQGMAAASPGAVLTHICHSHAIFHLQTSLEVSAYPFHLPGGQARVGKERAFPELWLGGSFCVRLEFAELGWEV